jgi:hypothetical protein
MTRSPYLSRTAYLALLAFGAIIVGTLTSAFDRHHYPFASDSAFYIEAARSLRDGQGLAVASAFTDTTREMEPLSLWPPGFPLSVAALSTVTAAPGAALWLARISWMLLPAVVFFALRPLIGIFGALGIGVLATLGPGVLQEGRIASTDVPFLILAILSLGVMIRAAAQPDRLKLWFCAGLLAGAAYVVRNVGLALFAAGAAGMSAAWVLGLWEFRATWRRGLAWAAGAAIFVLPLMAFNLSTWGSLQPYSMPPSTIGLVDNARGFLESQLMELFALHTLASLAWNAKWLLVFAVPVGIALAFAAFRFWRTADATLKFGTLLLALYVAAGACAVVLARTKYQWGETINLRHSIQYSWAIGAVIISLFSVLIPAQMRLIAAGAMAMALFCVVRVAYIWEEFNLAARATAAVASGSMGDADVQIGTRTLRTSIAQDTALLDHVRSMDPNAYVASNRADVLVIETGRHIRRIETTELAALSGTIGSIRQRLACDRALRIVLTLDAALLQAHGKDWQAAAAAQLKSVMTLREQSTHWMSWQTQGAACDTRAAANPA